MNRQQRRARERAERKAAKKNAAGLKHQPEKVQPLNNVMEKIQGHGLETYTHDLKRHWDNVLATLACFEWIFEKYEIPFEWLGKNLTIMPAGMVFFDGMYYEGYHAYVTPENRDKANSYPVAISFESPHRGDLPLPDIIDAVIHEATHIHQIYRGDLGITPNYENKIWKGEIWEENNKGNELAFNKLVHNDSSYDDRPWEREAIKNGKKYTKEFMENKDEIVSNFWAALEKPESNANIIKNCLIDMNKNN